jgi:hypothetical protein
MKTKTVIALAVPHSATGKVLKAEPGIRRRTLIKRMHRRPLLWRKKRVVGRF